MTRGVPALIDADSIIDRIAAGEYQSHIAKQLGIPPQTLHGQISTHPSYRIALEARNMGKLDDSQKGIDNTESDLARAREAFKAAAWRAERECPAVWGQRSKLDVNVSLSLDVVLGQMDEAIEGVVTNVVTDHSTSDDSQQDQ